MNGKPRTALFAGGVALWLGAFVLLLLNPHAWLLWGSVHLAILVLMLYASLRGNCRWLGPVICSFQTRANEIWLTIDDGPHPVETPRILALLKYFDARATFFLVGERVRAFPELARAIVEHGHSVGNHSAHHRAGVFWALPPGLAAREIEEGAAAIREVTGQWPKLFRAPVGMANIFVRRALFQRGMHLVGWTSRGFDTLSRSPEEIAQRVLRQTRPGAIVLLHEGDHSGSPSEVRLAALERVLAEVKARGCKCVLPSAVPPGVKQTIEPSDSIGVWPASGRIQTEHARNIGASRGA